MCTQLTRLEDLIADGEAGAVGLIVGHELDEELVPRGDDRRRGDLPAVLAHQLTALVHAVPNLDIVVPRRRRRRHKRESRRSATPGRTITLFFHVWYHVCLALCLHVSNEGSVQRVWFKRPLRSDINTQDNPSA